MTNISFEALSAPVVEEVEETMSVEEMELAIAEAEAHLMNVFAKDEQVSEIADIRAALLEVALEGDSSLLNFYKEPLESIGIDCSDTKTAAEGIAAVIEQFDARQIEDFKATFDIEDTDEVSEEVAFIALWGVAFAIYLATLAYVITVIMSIEGRVNKIDEIVEKGLRSEPKKRDKKILMLPFSSWQKIVPNITKAMDLTLNTLDNFTNENAKKVTDAMEKAGQIWDGKEYVAANWGVMSPLTIEQGKWNPAAIKTGLKDLTNLVTILIKTKTIEAKVKAAAKKANKEDGGGFFKKSERSKEIKANAKLAGKTMRHCAKIGTTTSRMLVPIAKQFEM